MLHQNQNPYMFLVITQLFIYIFKDYFLDLG